jgi:hypothetical protein
MFSRLNEWAARLIAGRDGATHVAAVSVSAGGFVLRMQRGTGPARDEPVAWREVEKVLAFNQPLPIGFEPVLWVLRGGGAIQLTPQVQGWAAYLQACETHLPGSLPTGLWQTRLLAGEAGQVIEVFSATPSIRGGAP